ncbi:MAG TPA: LPXTG cell wall anchor domain-containing protein [Armatimonadota bacterium]|nr:LPXTG cell wall anchor domain-containing protein [Armatimonadota bacterium]
MLTGVQSRVLASVEFAAVDAGTPGEDGDGGTGNGSPGDGHGTDTTPGADSSPDPLATTGADGTIGWVWTGLALTLLAAGTWLLHLRRRSA